jgi:hypothetical protein
MLLLLTQMGFFPEIHAFTQLNKICISGANRAYLNLENYDLEEVFL